MTPELLWGECDNCHQHSGDLQRYFIEIGEHSGNGPSLCPTCRRDRTLDAALESSDGPTGARPPSRQRRRAVTRQERETAKLIGGYVQKASGALSYAKGDVRLKGVLRGEMKSTEKKSFILKRAVLDKIRSECLGAEKPFLTVRFINPLTMATEDEWVVIPIEDWEHSKYAAAQHQ